MRAENFQCTVSVCLNKLFYCMLLFFLIVPPPSMSVFLTPNGTIYESTLLVITCNATLPSVVDTDVTATVTWTGSNGSVISSNDGRITVGQVLLIEGSVFQTKLTFSPVDNGDMNDNRTNDTGEYTCDTTISSTNQLILSGTNNISEGITVDSMFSYHFFVEPNFRYWFFHQIFLNSELIFRAVVQLKWFRN